MASVTITKVTKRIEDAQAYAVSMGGITTVFTRVEVDGVGYAHLYKGKYNYICAVYDNDIMVAFLSECENIDVPVECSELIL